MNTSLITNTSNPNPTATSGTSGATGSTATGLGQGLNEADFVKILASELQAQDPTNPMDPTQFIGQQVQFNMLDQLTQIRAILSAQQTASSGANSGSQAASAPVTTPGVNQ